MVLLGFVILFLAVVFSQAATDWTMDGGATIAGLEQCYGSLSKSFYSLFLSAMDGLSWDLRFTPLLHVHGGFAVAFLVYTGIVLSLPRCVLSL